MIASIRAMANELLDFVMSLVRDPDAAARYHADPAQAIADAHLNGVTSADVNNLLPMVSESLTSTTPTPGLSGHGDASVWTSGAATAAFDAFTPLVPAGHDIVAVSAVVDPGVQPAELPVGHDHAAPFSDVAAVPARFDSDSYQPPPTARTPAIRRTAAGRPGSTMVPRRPIGRVRTTLPTPVSTTSHSLRAA